MIKSDFLLKQAENLRRFWLVAWNSRAASSSQSEAALYLIYVIMPPLLSLPWLTYELIKWSEVGPSCQTAIIRSLLGATHINHSFIHRLFLTILEMWIFNVLDLCKDHGLQEGTAIDDHRVVTSDGNISVDVSDSFCRQCSLVFFHPFRWSKQSWFFSSPAAKLYCSSWTPA